MSEYRIRRSVAYGEEGEAYGIAKFTIGATQGGFLVEDSLQSVAVEVEFDPHTKTWSAKIISSWKGRI